MLKVELGGTNWAQNFALEVFGDRDGVELEEDVECGRLSFRGGSWGLDSAQIWAESSGCRLKDATVAPPVMNLVAAACQAAKLGPCSHETRITSTISTFESINWHSESLSAAAMAPGEAPEMDPGQMCQAFNRIFSLSERVVPEPEPQVRESVSTGAGVILEFLSI